MSTSVSKTRLAKARALATTSMVAMVASAIVAPQPAKAQTPAPQTAQAPAVEEVIVTGSRIIRDGYEAPTPVSVVATEAIEAAARPDIADFINTLPAVAGSFTPASGTGNLSGGRGGINAISLHGLGPSRTLVLLDGHRGVVSSASGDIDVSAFPQGLVSRVDVVTGGASAAYGSDAVGGVVNFILDKNFTGLKGDISGGLSTYGDELNYKASLSGGAAFGDGKGHALFSLESSLSKGMPIYSRARDWPAYGWTGIQNPAYGTGPGQTTSVPAFLFGPHTGDSNVVAGGIIVSGPLKGTAFGAKGVPRQFNYGSINGGILTRGGDWDAQKPYAMASLDPPTNRKNAFVRVSYDVADSTNVFFEASWSDDWEANGVGAVYFPGNLTLSAANPFLPASVAAQAAANKVTQFAFGTLLTFDNGDQSNYKNPSGATGLLGLQRRILNRYLFDINGKVEALDTDWKWDAYIQRGQANTSEKTANNIDNTKFRQALDSVVNPATGNIVCRSTLTNPTNGCVPFNPFGLMFNVNDRAAFNWSFGVSQRNQRLIENVAAASVSGEPFSSWAGPVSIATGVEWRNEKVNGVSDPISLAFGWFNSSYQPTIGSFNVKEGFLETLVPLAKDLPWAKNFDVDLAGRVTDYSNAGTVETWKIGSTLQVVDAVRIRGSISRDVRAPNLGELFAGGSNSAAAGAGLLDPFNNNLPSQGALNINGAGNPNLKPESAISKGIGAVIQPDFWPGFSFSADYWSVNMSGAISGLSPQDTINGCYNGDQRLCPAVIRANGILTVKSLSYNVAINNYAGIDFESGYRLALSDVSSNMDGNLDFRILASLLLKDYVNPGALSPSLLPSDLVGGPTIRKWRYSGTITYEADPITLVLQGRGFSSGVANTLWIQCTSNCPVSTAQRPTIDNMFQRGDFDVDTTLTYKFADGIATYVSVQNWLNKSPPPVPTGVTGNNATYYDAPSFTRGAYNITGRMFRVGLRFKM